MRPISRLALVALIALTWTSLATAETPDINSPLEIDAFASITALALDAAFEESMAERSDPLLRSLGGPTTMKCARAPSAVETCVVTATGTPKEISTETLAQH